MRKVISMLFAAAIIIGADAQENKKARIEFDKKTVDLGRFGYENAVQHCYFIFKNTGEADLYIHQIFTSCGCTDKRYPTHPISPGMSDTIFVTYNGEKKSPRKFRTSITVHSNGIPEMTKLYIKGEQLPKKVVENEVIEIEE